MGSEVGKDCELFEDLSVAADERLELVLELVASVVGRSIVFKIVELVDVEGKTLATVVEEKVVPELKVVGETFVLLLV